MTRLFLDTEFIDTGSQIHLLSIGVVRDDGATYYAEPWEAPLAEASDWVRENVLPYLATANGKARAPRSIVKGRADIAAELIDFAGPEPEWWAYMADYDWVILSQLYGPLVNRPTGWPFWCRDVAQLAEMVGLDLKTVPQDGTEHHALADAQWVRKAWEACTEVIAGWEDAFEDQMATERRRP